MKKLRKLTVKGLRAWLEAQPAGKIFNTRDSHHCPIAQFVDEDHAVYTRYIALHSATVASGNDLLLGDPRRIELPQWAMSFIKKVDELWTISREDALKVLAEVTGKE